MRNRKIEEDKWKLDITVKKNVDSYWQVVFVETIMTKGSLESEGNLDEKQKSRGRSVEIGYHGKEKDW